MVEKLLDKTSYGLVRTNPKLTGNVKVVSNGTDIYLESFSANERLSSSAFKSFKVDENSTYDKDVFNFFQNGKFPKDLAYEVFQEFTDISVLNSYGNQFEMFYSSGTRSISSESYSEDLGMLAPIWLDDIMPKYFVIFRLDDPAAINNLNATSPNASGGIAQTSIKFKEHVLENCTAIKTFDLRESAPLGKYIRNYKNQESFPIAPLTTTWRRDEPFLWNGISYKSGGFASSGNFVYDDIVAKDTTIIQNEFFFTQGFERNGILCANLLNLEFLFTDENAPDYSINRYFGLYVNEVEEGKFDISGDGFYRNLEKTQFPKITSINQISEKLNKPLELTNQNGILIYIDPTRTTTTTALPTPQRVDEVESIFYVKDKTDTFHTVKKGSRWGVDQLRLFDKKIDISVLTGFKKPDTFTTATVLKEKGKSTAFIKVLGEIPDGAKITFFDGSDETGEIAANKLLTNGPGTNHFQFFNPTGTPDEIAISITNAIRAGISESKRFFNPTYNKDTVYLQSRFGGDRFNRLSFKLNWDEYPDLNTQTYPETSETTLQQNFVGGNNFKNSLLKVPIGTQERFIKDNFVQTKGGYATINDWVPYLEEPIYNSVGAIIGYTSVDNFVIITLNDNQIKTTKNGQVALYSDYKPSFGRFSIFPVRDFDFDFYSTMYSDLGELVFEKTYYNQATPNTEPPTYTGVSSNPDIREFYTNGSFVELIGLLRGVSEDSTNTDKVINSEYDRLEENYLKQQAVASRVIPYINKWGYMNDGKNVRNLPYKLNLSESFGRNNLAPSKWTLGQNPEGFTHEWYYLCEFPSYFSQDAIKSSWSYIDTSPEDTIENNPLTSAVYTPGTFQRIDKNLFDEYFIADKFITSGIGITLIDRQLRYSRFNGGDSENFSETFLRGVRVIAKPKALGSQKANFNARKLNYVRNGNFNDYKFSAMLIPNNSGKPETQIKFIKNEKWKTVTMLIFVTIDDSCLVGSTHKIDRTSLYSIQSNFLSNSACAPILNAAGNYEYNNGNMDGAISFTSTDWDSNLSSYRVVGIPDINGNPTVFTRDIQIRPDGNYTPIIINEGSDVYKISDISRILSNDRLLAKTVTKNGSAINLPKANPTTIALKEAEYKTEGGGFNQFSSRLGEVGFASIFKNVNQGNPDVVYETIKEDGDRVLNANGSLAQTFSIELRSQDDILKSVYVGALPDQDKPTSFNLTDVIGYNLSIQTRPRLTPICRHSGNYEPISTPIFKYRDPYLDVDFSQVITDENYKLKVLELCRYKNTQFHSSDLTFGILNNLFFHKVNQEDPSTILELSADSAFLSLYPLINEVGISSKDYYTFSSNWEPSYFTKSIDKTAISDVTGTRSMKEKKSFFGSKYLKVPQEIILESFTPSEYVKSAIKQPSLIDGTFMHLDNASNIEFYLFNEKKLVEFLFIPIKETFKKYINPLFGFGNEEILDDDVSQYIKLNILKLYKIENVDFYVKSDRLNQSNNYDTAKLTNINKTIEGLKISEAFSSIVLNNNPFDLKLIYNKRTGFSESFGFSVRLIKK
tara:strand:- start:68261 stop:72856 length:4596 start_codon:yes stop_codon:yes gene_type:complete